VRILDRYVLGSFLKAFAGSLVIFTVSVVVLDFFSRMGRFTNAVERAEGVIPEDLGRIGIVVRFYLAYVPFILKEVLPFVTVAAGVFTLSTLLRNNEVMPALAAGVSGRRLLAPLLAFGVAVALGHLAFQEFVVPALGREQLTLRRLFEGERSDLVYRLPHIRDGKGTVVRAGSYRFADRTLRDVIVQRPWTDAGFESIGTRELTGDGDGWKVAAEGRIYPAAPGAEAIPLPVGTRVDLGVSPAEVDALVSKHGTQEISTRDLRALSRRFPQRRSLLVAVHKQMARPFSSFILLLLGLPILLEAGRKHFFGGAVAFFLCGSYYLLDIFLTSLGDRGDLAPALAAYGPVALYGSLGFARLFSLST